MHSQVLWHWKKYFCAFILRDNNRACVRRERRKSQMYFWNTGFWNYPVGWHCMVLIKSMQMAKAIKFLCGLLLILWLANGKCVLFYHPALQLQHVKGCAGEETQDLHASSCLWLHMWKKESALSSKSKVLHIGTSWKWSGPYQLWKLSKRNLRWTTREVLRCVFNYLTKNWDKMPKQSVKSKASFLKFALKTKTKIVEVSCKDSCLYSIIYL